MAITEGTLLAGRYRAERLLGRGGMGEVWSCRDLEQDAAIAIKLVRPDVLDENTERLFRNEIVATARLAHPSIVPVYDILDGEALGLVMELRAGSPLARTPVREFGFLREVLCQVLSALAYAHSRGVLHLDVKPDNVIVEQRDGAIRATLVDFGIARVRRLGLGVDRTDSVLGTLAYMAPEQLMGEQDRFGPWTDLYALGAMTYHMTSGQRPYPDDALLARTQKPPPPLAPRIAVPPGLAELCMWLLAIDDKDRPTHAADVLHALRGLPSVAGETIDARPHAPFRSIDPAPGAYALFGLREVPLLGRAEERAAVWRALERTVRDRETSVIVLEGPAGVGKSRIARDCIEHAHELGLCHVAQTSWSEDATGDEGVRGLIENVLESRGAPLDVVFRMLDHWLARYGTTRDEDEHLRREALLLLRPPLSASPDAALPLRVALSMIERLCATRPALLWLDDAHLSRGEAAAFVDAIRKSALPVCAIATARDEGIESLERIVNDAQTVQLTRLDSDAAQRLVRGLLDVDDELCALVAARAEGNPLFVTQLLAEMVQASAIVRSEGRYRLAEHYDIEGVPRDAARLWERRLERIAADRSALAVLAVTRERVSTEIARQLEKPYGARIRNATSRALQGGLLRIEAGEYAWVHGLLRAHLVNTVAARERPTLHKHAALALAPLIGREDVQAERAHHLWQAGELRDACEAMLSAVDWCGRRAELAREASRARELAGWAAHAGFPDLEARAFSEIANVEVTLGRFEPAVATMAQADAIVEANGLVAPWVEIRGAHVARMVGREAEGHARSLRALSLARKSGDVHAEGTAHSELGLDAARSRDFDAAHEHLSRAAELLHLCEDRVGEARALYLRFEGRGEDDLALCERAIRIAREAGAVRVELAALAFYVGALWVLGRREEARREADRAAREARRVAHRRLALVLEELGAYWALSESNYELAAAHRDRARADAAGTRMGSDICWLAAIDATLFLASGDVASATEQIAIIERERGRYDEWDFRDLLGIVERHAPPELAARIARMLAKRDDT